jgi:hypothetical protein
LGALALAGGFDEIKEDDQTDPYPYSSRELMEMYPERYRSGPIIAPRRKTLEDKIEFGTQFAAKGGEMEFPVVKDISRAPAQRLLTTFQQCYRTASLL